jgi:hypothetical protein
MRARATVQHGTTAIKTSSGARMSFMVYRCTDASVQVVSLIEFVGMGSLAVRARYLPQVRFLINHLQLRDGSVSRSSEAELRGRILAGKEGPMEITTSNLREAKAGLVRAIGSTGDAAYVLACANLLNAAAISLHNRRLRCAPRSFTSAIDLSAWPTV